MFERLVNGLGEPAGIIVTRIKSDDLVVKLPGAVENSVENPDPKVRLRVIDNDGDRIGNVGG